ncbi:GIY-YIG nuclease family protein [Arthrobacter mobilis]|uniref:GIY-YIG catalytic domain-containing protein n=1 Tax=Arthrobacter mobilis TaxID=2724944 RepID=A0A7X6HGH5_9MICC|nr:hypothetical protein [Arthrobacter mobilis]NKX55950.1 hypothetical protein [Arthrobacter mobilis]
MDSTISDNIAVIRQLLAPARLYTREEVLGRPSPAPRASGIYAWYFDELPPGVDVRGCHVIPEGVLLYVGIAPKEPPRNGTRPSTQTLWHRIRYHYRGNAYGSTLRLTLGCHLAGTLGIELRRVGSGNRLTFTSNGERQISEWMSRHARVTWVQAESPWRPETLAIEELSLPLNLQGNSHHPYYPTLKNLRAKHRAAARELPIV